MGTKILHDERGDGNNEVIIGILILVSFLVIIGVVFYFIIQFIISHLIETFLFFAVLFIFFSILSLINTITTWIQPSNSILTKSETSRLVFLNLLSLAPMYYKYYKEKKKHSKLQIELDNIKKESSNCLTKIIKYDKDIDIMNNKKSFKPATPHELSIIEDKKLKVTEYKISLDAQDLNLSDDIKSLKGIIDEINEKAHEFIMIKAENKQLNS